MQYGLHAVSSLPYSLHRLASEDRSLCIQREQTSTDKINRFCFILDFKEQDEMDIDFQQIAVNIRRGTYKYIGQGSGRLVFDLGNGTVIKAAKNRKGIAQNKAEYEIASSSDCHLFARVLHTSVDFDYLMMEKAEKIQDMSFVKEYFRVKSTRELLKNEALMEISNRFHLLSGDLARVSSWGKIRGKPAIIDFGFTREVRQKYYRKKWKIMAFR